MTAPMATIEAARIHARGDIRVEREPAAAPGPAEVLLRVTGVGLCGSDLHWFEEASIGDSVLSRPLILGHEIGAVIADGPRAGERVAVDPAANCDRCGPCLEGKTNLCLAMRFAGHGITDGALRTFMAWPERLLSPLPDSIDDDEAPVLEPLGVALHALDLGPVSRGGRAGVYGAGPIGLLLVQLLRVRGLSTIVATDRLSHRVAAAKSMGATDALLVDGDAGPNFTPSRVMARELPVDVAFEVSGSDAALSDAISAVRPGGRVVLVGIPSGDRTSFEAATARRKELSLLECRRMLGSDLQRAIELVSAGSIDLGSLITDRFPLARAPEAFAALAERRGLKVIVKPGAD
jgi:L-iditol 2-dehydrogenase